MESVDDDNPASGMAMVGIHSYYLVNIAASSAPDVFVPSATVTHNSTVDSMNRLKPLQNGKGDNIASDVEGLPIDPEKATNIAYNVAYLQGRAPTPYPFGDSSVNMDWESEHPTKPLDDEVIDAYSVLKADVPATTGTDHQKPDDKLVSTELQIDEEDDAMQGFEYDDGIDRMVLEVFNFDPSFFNDDESASESSSDDDVDDLSTPPPAKLPRTVTTFVSASDVPNSPASYEGANASQSIPPTLQIVETRSEKSVLLIHLPDESADHQFNNESYQNEGVNDESWFRNNDVTANYNVNDVFYYLNKKVVQHVPAEQVCSPLIDKPFRELSIKEKPIIKKKRGRPMKKDAKENSKKTQDHREKLKELDIAASKYIYEGFKRGGQLAEPQRIVLCASFMTIINIMAYEYAWDSTVYKDNVCYIEPAAPKAKTSKLGPPIKDDGKNAEKRAKQRQANREKGYGVRFKLLGDLLRELEAKLFNDYSEVMSVMEQDDKYLHDNLTGKCRRRPRPRVVAHVDPPDLPVNAVPPIRVFDAENGRKAKGSSGARTSGNVAQISARKKDGVRSGKVSKPPRPKGRTDHPPGIT